MALPGPFPHLHFGLALLLAAAAPAAGAMEAIPLCRTFSSGDFGGEPYAWRFRQIPNGPLVVGGERLGFYENNRWKFVSTFHKVAIRDLLVDGNTLWIASEGEIGRVRLPLAEGSTYTPLTVPPIAQAGEIWHLEKSGDRLVAVTSRDVWFISTDGASVVTVPLPPDRRRLLAHQWPDRTILASSASSLWELRDGRIAPFKNPLPDPTDIHWNGTDGAFVLTTRALYRREGDEWQVAIRLDDSFKSDIVTLVARWENKIVVGTANRGLIFLDPQNATIQLTQDAAGLGSENISTGFIDANGRLWVGAGKGVAVFEAPRFGHRYRMAIPPLLAARCDGLVVSTESNTYHYHENGEVSSIGERAWSFQATSAGPVFGLWLKTRLRDQPVATTGGQVSAIMELADQRVFVAAGERCYVVDPKTGAAEPVASPRTNFTGLALVGGQLWAAGSDSQLYRSKPGPDFAFTPGAKLPGAGEPILGVCGEHLISASNAGVFFGPELRPVEHTSGLRNPMLAANADGLWLGGEQDGVYRLGRLLNQATAVRWETVEARALANLHDVRAMTGAGNLLTFCADSSVIELNTRLLRDGHRLAPPQLAFTFFDLGKGAGTTRASPPTELAADANSLAFSGTIPFDEFGEPPRFERRLLPTEAAWVPTKPGEVVSYPSLSPRTYTLEVRTTHLGRTGTAQAHRFTVLPPWYATRSAVAGYLALAAAGFYGLYRLRTHNLRRRTAELERIVEERNHALKEASEAKTEFLASMSHEIRNPMNGVIGLVDILREQPASPRQEQTLRLLQHCADQLRSTVDDILDFSRIEAGRVALERAAFDLGDTLEAAAVTIDPAGTRIAFLDRPPPGLTLVGDVGKLRQILANYLSNALKYGVPPGARVSTLLTPADGGVRLTIGVASSGPTIPKDTLDKFFESFTRGAAAIERNIHGTGLGLAICRRYAQAMGGEVGAVSANGETTFYLNLPFARTDGTAAAAAPSPAPPSLLPARALAIEDEDYNRIVLGSILARMNYTVDWATTGAEALKLAQENGYDIILTDYRLPDTNGVELTGRILGLCPEPKPAVFAVTAYSTKERRDECLNAGMSGFISKPITLEKLRTTLAGWGEKNLARISLETSRLPQPAWLPHRPREIAETWQQLQATIAHDAKRAADLAHRLNNLCRAHRLIDAAEQFELLEGALERGEPTGVFLRACEEFLRG
ncbi:MAG: response regulator [Verrucomicrobia bacterium]|nr:response regulator [Verrucomicrobiota bacterium]